MVNTHVFYHRIPALSTAILATIAYSFLLAAGTACDFIHVYAKLGYPLEYTTEDGIVVDVYDTSLGLFCETPPLFVRGTDQLWTMSYYFWVASAVVGAFGVVMAWALATFIGPTDCNWKMLSFVSGVSAILQAPIFLLFASQPCKENICQMSTGAVMLSISTLFWMTLMLLTQCQDPPMWANELNAWRVVQKERQEGVVVVAQSSSPQRSRESRWSRWVKRKKWASTLGLAPTDSESVNDVSRLELLENGSYYADSNNSRLMLKVTADGMRPGDDNRSVTTFGDLEDMVKYADEERNLSALMMEQNQSPRKEQNPVDVLGDSNNSPREIFIIHSHIDTPVKSDKKVDRALLLGDDEFQDSSNMQPERQVIITGIRALAKRMRRDARRNKTGYSYLDSDGDSDADVEDEIDDRRSESHPPMSPMSPTQLNELSQQEIPSPMRVNGSNNHELLHDWNALHAAANAGILLPATAPNGDMKDDDEPEPANYSSDDSAKEISLEAYLLDFPEDEDLEDAMSGSTLSSDSSNDEGRPKRQQRRKRTTRRAFSATNSVASRTSLLELTIEEETAGDLQEMGSSDEEQKTPKKGLSQAYALRGVKSAPDRFSFEPLPKTFSPKQQSDTNTLLRGELDCVSEDSSSNVSEVLRKADKARIVSPVAQDDNECTELNSSIESEVGMSPVGPRKSPHRNRGRCLSVPRRKLSSVHPISPVPRGKSAAARFRDERVEKAGIHSPHINVVSDEDTSASDDLDDDSLKDRSFRSTVSRRARRARVKRLHDDIQRRRSRTVDPPNKRRGPPKPEIVFDPTLRAILVNRDPGSEYGPEEASL